MDTIRTPSEARKNGPTEFRETEREKTYTYQRDGKTITIKRKWNNSLCGKQQALNKYFETYKDDISKMKNYKDIFRDYNEKNGDNKVSYTTILKRARGLLNKATEEELKE